MAGDSLSPLGLNGSHNGAGVRGAAQHGLAEVLAAGGTRVRLFDREPDLLADLEPEAADALRRHVTVPHVAIDAGGWDPRSAHDEGFTFGLLVLDGHLVRTIDVEGRPSPELLGPGDLLRPWQDYDHGSVSYQVTWTALSAASVAVLDRTVAAAVARHPQIASRLIGRATERARALEVQLALAHIRRAETRLLVLLWHLADRWGRVTPEGVVLPLCLTHELLAQLACIRRPTASTSLTRLGRGGEVTRRPDGTWLLKGEPPALVAA